MIIPELFSELWSGDGVIVDVLIGPKETKGDLPGHPFRGNQWSGGRQGTSSTDSSFAMADDTRVLTGTLSQLAPVSRKVDSSSVKSDSALKAGSNSVRVVEIEEDGQVNKYAFKEADGECAGVWEKFRGRQCVCEAAASAVAEEMGLGDMVAKTELAEVAGKKGALQRWVNDEAKTASAVLGDDDPIPSSRMDELRQFTDGIDDMMHYDALIGNDDRHLKNWMVKNDKVVLIDNGRSFAKNDQYDDFENSWFRGMEHDELYRMNPIPVSDKFKAGLDKMIGNRETVDARLKGIGLEDAQRAAFWKRAEHLQKMANDGTPRWFDDTTLRQVARGAEGKGLF